MAGGGATGNTTVGTTTTGVVYPVVIGLTYQTNSASGVVAADGSYKYQAQENVTFSAGGIELATVPAAATVTPLPLDDDVASTNLLRLFTALDAGAISDGFSLPQLPASNFQIDLSSESSVAAALTSLAPTATLPSASDVKVTTILAASITTALQNMGTYGSTYTAIIVQPRVAVDPPPAHQPKNAVMNLTSQPNWSTGAMTGTATLTLNDNSQVPFSYTNVNGTYPALGIAQTYSFKQIYSGKTRVIRMYSGDVLTNGGADVHSTIILRDNSQPNIPPVARANSTSIDFGGQAGPNVHHFISQPGIPGGISNGSSDPDGLIVSQTWSSSKGKTGTGNTFSESFFTGETGSITITVTDDEGATASRTYSINTGASTPTTALPWASVSAGTFHTLATKTDGTLWAWGDNSYGQLGDGTNLYKNVPIQIGIATNWASVSVGSSNTLATKADGTLWAWGHNSYGQLGDGTTVNKNAPTQIGAVTTWASVSARTVQTLATKTDGTLWAWGYNFYGQLGDGTTVSKSVPVNIP